MKKTNIIFLVIATILFSFIPKNLAFAEEIKINAKSAITLDIDSGEIIYSKDIDAKMYPASITKLMTAILLATNKSKTDNLQYTKGAKSQPEYSLNTNLRSIGTDETLTASDIMDAMLLYSGNDAAYVAADNVSGNAVNFSNLMNEEAKKLKLTNSHFITPNGLHDENHYTTAYDLTLIGREAFKNPWIKETLAKQKSTIKTSKGTIFMLQNRNKLLGKNGNLGGKTGYTSQSGRCLISFYERDGKKMVGVVLNSIYDANDTYVFSDMEKIIDWSYSQVQVPIIKKGITLRTVDFTYKQFKFFGKEKTISLPIYLNDDVKYYENVVNKKELTTSYKIEPINPWNLAKGTTVGTITVNQRENVKTYNLYTNVTSSDLIKANQSTYIITAIVILLCIFLFLLIIFKLLKLSKRKKRGKYY